MKRMSWMISAVFLGAVLAVPQVGHAEKTRTRDAVEGKCNEKGGVFFPPGRFYACLYPDGSGIVCGGAKKGCDTWPANPPPGSLPRRAQELHIPEKLPKK